MTVVYFDSRALVKLIVEEPGGELAAQLWDGCDAAISSRLAYPEVCALCWPRRVEPVTSSERSSSDAGVAWEEIWAATRGVELTDSVAVHAGDLAGRLSLCGADAVHLASLLAIGTEGILFDVWEQRLPAGAWAAAVHVVPESP